MYEQMMVNGEMQWVESGSVEYETGKSRVRTLSNVMSRASRAASAVSFVGIPNSGWNRTFSDKLFASISIGEWEDEPPGNGNGYDDFSATIGSVGRGIPVPAGGTLEIPINSSHGGGGGNGSWATAAYDYNTNDRSIFNEYDSTEEVLRDEYNQEEILVTVYNAANGAAIRSYSIQDYRDTSYDVYIGFCSGSNQDHYVDFGTYSGDFTGLWSYHDHHAGEMDDGTWVGCATCYAITGTLTVDIPRGVESVFVRISGHYVFNGDTDDVGGLWTLNWRIPCYTVVYNPNGGVGSIEPQAIPYGESMTVRDNNFTRVGYIYKEFNTKADGTGYSFAPGTYLYKPDWSTYIPGFNGTVTLYAIWEPIKYNVNVYPNPPEDATRTVQMIK